MSPPVYVGGRLSKKSHKAMEKPLFSRKSVERADENQPEPRKRPKVVSRNFFEALWPPSIHQSNGISGPNIKSSISTHFVASVSQRQIHETLKLGKPRPDSLLSLSANVIEGVAIRWRCCNVRAGPNFQPPVLLGAVTSDNVDRH